MLVGDGYNSILNMDVAFAYHRVIYDDDSGYDYEVVDFNPAYAVLVGLPEEEVPGSHYGRFSARFLIRGRNGSGSSEKWPMMAAVKF